MSLDLGPAPRIIITELVKAYGETTIPVENAEKMFGLSEELIIENLTDEQLVVAALCQAHDYINRQTAMIEALQLKVQIDAKRIASGGAPLNRAQRRKVAKARQKHELAHLKSPAE